MVVECCGVQIEVQGKSGRILKSLAREGDGYIDGFYDAVEAVVLAAACEGIDVQSPAFVQTVQAALDGMCNSL